jgi:hypothetical protein
MEKSRIKTSEVRTYGLSDGELSEGRSSAETPPAAIPEMQIVQLFAVLSGVFVWRATWGLTQLWFGDGYGSTIGTLVYGVGVCIFSRSVPWARKLLAATPTTMAEKLMQQALFLVVVSGTSLIWRGSWLIVDNFLSFTEAPMLVLSLCIGALCSSVINLTGLRQLLITDTVALVGG